MQLSYQKKCWKFFFKMCVLLFISVIKYDLSIDSIFNRDCNIIFYFYYLLFIFLIYCQILLSPLYLSPWAIAAPLSNLRSLTLDHIQWIELLPKYLKYNMLDKAWQTSFGA